MLTDIQGLNQLLTDKKYILIVLRRDADTDAIAGGLALKAFLEKQHKQADIVSDGFSIPKQLKFLSQIEKVKSELAHLQKFIIKVDISKAPIESLSYDVKDNTLSIYLSPRQGVITKNDLRTAQSAFKYDLIITVGAADLESLGGVYHNNTDLFFRAPVVNIDHSAGNEHFGQINLVEITATANCEIIHKIIQRLGAALLDDKMATCLLAGMIAKTRSFKTTNVSPATLQLASELISAGGERDKIVQNLYRTKAISTLKLWGQALTHLQSDGRFGLVWATLTREDFARSGATEDDLKDIVEELIGNSPEAKVVLLLYEKDGGVAGQIVCDRDYDAKALTQRYGAAGNKRLAQFTINDRTLKEAENEIISDLKTKITA